jgi:hypothetical protein
MTDPHARLRALYRQHGEPGYAIVKAEYERLGLTIPLDHILKDAWKEGRELAGQTYDYTAQSWRDKDGNRINE